MEEKSKKKKFKKSCLPNKETATYRIKHYDKMTVILFEWRSFLMLPF